MNTEEVLKRLRDDALKIWMRYKNKHFQDLYFTYKDLYAAYKEMERHKQ